MKPWYQIVTPREDLRDDKPFDVLQFAVHPNLVPDWRT
jgi:hypothetical protein